MKALFLIFILIGCASAPPGTFLEVREEAKKLCGKEKDSFRFYDLFSVTCWDGSEYVRNEVTEEFRRLDSANPEAN